jgi:hypothetical protein
MLVVRDTWEEIMLSRSENRLFGQTENRCFRFAALYGRYCFHVNVQKTVEDPSTPWFHFVAADIYGLLSILDDIGPDAEQKVRITLQTPFSEMEPSKLVEVEKVVRGYDRKQNEVFFCTSIDDSTYFITMSASILLVQKTTVWP